MKTQVMKLKLCEFKFSKRERNKATVFAFLQIK